MTLGRFITFEGVDGAGKSTQLEYAVKYLEDRGIDVIKTREPGGTEIGETIRELILQASSPLDASTELLMIFAARNEHIERVIKPAIARGSTVVCDRFTDATFAYQGGGSQMDSARIETIETWVQGTLQPNLTFFFDLPIRDAQRRMGDRSRDRFESEEIVFHERVRRTYLERAEQFPDRIKVIDSTRSKGQVRVSVEQQLAALCGL
jgi:dTMP kinase